MKFWHFGLNDHQHKLNSCRLIYFWSSLNLLTITSALQYWKLCYILSIHGDELQEAGKGEKLHLNLKIQLHYWQNGALWFKVDNSKQTFVLTKTAYNGISAF